MTDTDQSERLLKLLQAKAVNPANPDKPQPLDFGEDLIPEDDQPERSTEDINLDRRLKDYPIEEAYIRWVGKGSPKMSGRADSNMVRCPRPDHTDSVPSAWFNVQKNTGTCSVCQSASTGRQWGFDPYDLYAIGAGYNVDTYKTDGSFPELRRGMAEELGFQVVRSMGGKEFVTTHLVPPEAPPESPPEGHEGRHLRVVPFEAPEGDTGPLAEFSGGAIDWRTILGDDSTFLRAWMNLCTEDDLPEEFYFWLGLSALGLACGNDYVLADRHDVRGNLLVCLVGKPGLGKSNSIDALQKLMREGLPFHPGRPGGVRHIPDPGSGEALVDTFVMKDEDGEPIPVRGLLVVGELASLTGKAQRSGNTLKTTIQALHDTASPYGITSRGAKDVIATGHFCSVVTTTQPGMLGELLNRHDSNSGFISRWVFATGTTKPLVPYGATTLDVESLRKPIADIRSFATKRRQITLDDEARSIWAEFFHAELEPVKLGNEPIFARVDLLMKKLMLLFAADKQKAYVGPATVRQAMALWPYLKTIYGLVDQRTTSSPQVSDRAELEERIILAIMALGDGNRSVDSLYKYMGSASRKAGRDSINQAIKTLETSGVIEPFVAKREGRGRPRGVEYQVIR